MKKSGRSSRPARSIEHVHDPGGGGRDDADRGSGQASLPDERREDGHRGDRHGHAHEQNERVTGGRFAERGEPGSEHQHTGHAQDHGGEERSDGDQRHRAAQAPQRPEIYLVADREHEKHDTDLRERRQRRHHHRREQVPGEMTGQSAEQARPEKQPGQHLADDEGLAQSLDHGAKQDGRRDDQCDVTRSPWSKCRSPCRETHGWEAIPRC